MKKLSVLLAVLLLAMSLAGCSVELKIKAEHVLSYFDALTAGDEAAAEAMMHAENEQIQAGTYPEAFDEMSSFLNGRKAVSAALQSFEASTQIGGNKVTEYGVYTVTLDDGTALTVNYTYVENSAGTGFAGFTFSVEVGRT